MYWIKGIVFVLLPNKMIFNAGSYYFYIQLHESLYEPHLLGPGLLRNFHVKIHVSYQGFSNMAFDWLEALKESLLTNMGLNVLDLS